MVIGLIVYGSINTLTGGYLYDKYLVSHLQRCGHRIRLLPMPMRSYPLRFGHNLSKRHLKQVCRAKLDLLLQDELCHPSLFQYNRRLRKQTTLPVISIVHHLMSSEPRQRWLNGFLSIIEKSYLDRVDGFIFNSRSTRSAVLQLSPKQRPCVVAPPGGDRLAGRITEAEIMDRATQSGPLRLVFLGLVIRRKGLLPLVEALSRIDPSSWRLDVIGNLTMDPATVNKSIDCLRHAGLTANVIFWGTVSDEVLADKLAEAHLLCMPFAYEGFGIATIEALSLGLPVLASTRGASGELIEQGVCGHLFDPDDVQGVAAAVSQLHADRGRLAEMGIAAYHRSKRHMGWKDSMQRAEAFLSQMTPPSGPIHHDIA